MIHFVWELSRWRPLQRVFIPFLLLLHLFTAALIAVDRLNAGNVEWEWMRKYGRKWVKKTREIESSSGNCVKWWWVAPDRIAKDQLLIAIKVNQVCASVSACLSVSVRVCVSCQYRERGKTIAFKVNNWNWKWTRWSIHEMRNCKRVRVCRYFSME